MSQTGAWFWFRFTGLQKRHEVCKACVSYYNAYSFFHFPSNDFFLNFLQFFLHQSPTIKKIGHYAF